MRFLKTFFRFFTIVTLCTTFTGGVWGTDCQTNIIQADTCNKHEGCYNNEGWGRSNCHECPKGNKCPYSTSSSKNPQACNNGTYQDLTGQAGCKTCSAGTMTPNDGNAYTSCTKCSAGTYSAAGASSCSNCAPGSYSGAAGASSCTKCPVGFYQSEGGQKDCVKCPDGTTTSGEGKTDSSDCKKKFNLALYVEYQQGGNTGIYSVSTSTIPYYEGTTAVHSITTMKYQLANKISDLKNKYTAPTETNQAYISINGTKYSLTSNGDNWQSTSTLTNALASQAHDSTFNLVFILQPKTYKVYLLSDSTNAGSSTASATLPKTVSINTTELIEYNFGISPITPSNISTNDITNCTTTTQMVNPISTVYSYGYIASTTTPKYYECTVTGNTASITIIDGKAGMFEPSADGKHICIGYAHTTCEAGYKCNKCSRTACTAGTYQSLTGQSSCSNCVAGTYSSGTANATCTPCAAGTYSSGTANASCTSCAAGKYQDATGQSSCKTCSTETSGKYTSSAAGSDAISDCYLTLSDGKYVPTAGGGEQDCPAGSYCSKKGTTVYHSTNTPTTVTTSGQCDVGTYSGSGQTSCTSCTAGTYQDATGQSSCKDCDAGTYSSGTANTTCTQCAVGKYQDETGKSSCKPCNNGYYQDETGKTSCKICADGTYTPKNPVTASFAACISCASNEISNSNHNGCDTCQASDGQISHNNQCRVCPSGTMVNTAGNGCEACASGTYNESAKGSCDSCGSGFFITDKTTNTDSATTDIAPEIGASTQTACYLNPGLMLKDSIGTSDVTLKSLSEDNKIYYVKPSSQQ